MNTYLPSESLLQSLLTSQLLNRPLLLTGEPGTGKTKFADFVRDTGYGGIGYGDVDKFFTKSTSLSQDIFYEFDAIAYFASRQFKEEKPITAFIYLKSLGKAICNAMGKQKVTEALQNCAYYQEVIDEQHKAAFIDAFVSQVSLDPANTIVLIDEIDKAPRDFPNDVLNEIDEGYQFKIKELGAYFDLKDGGKIQVIITSNFEKNLPEPFLRRCVYFNIEFPSDTELLEIISLKYFTPLDAELRQTSLADIRKKTESKTLLELIDRIEQITGFRRNPAIIKKPSTSEILDFFCCLTDPASDSKLSNSISKSHPYVTALIKRKEDLSQV